MTETLTTQRRAVLEARLIERLERLDDAALLRAAEIILGPGHEPRLDRKRENPRSAESGAAPSSSFHPQARSGGWTRRQVLAGTVVGGMAVAGAATGAGVLGTVRGAADAVTELQAEASLALERWQGLVALYQRLDDIGLDDVVNNGLAAVAGALGNVQALTTRLQSGLERTEASLAALDESLAVLDDALVAAEGAITRLAEAVQALEDHLEAVGERVAPLTEALGGFFKDLVGRIPFGVGDRILATIERVQAVVTTVPETIASLNSRLIEPVRQRFFPREGGTLQVRLFDPLVAALFDPAEKLLAAITTLAERWEAELAGPAQQRIAARAQVREAIARYRAENNLT